MRVLTGLLIPCTVSACITAVPSEEPVTAQRPIYSTDTATAPEGTAEFQLGGTWEPHSFGDTPFYLGYGVTPSTELFVGGSPVLHVDEPGSSETGFGDLTLGVRDRFTEEEGGAPSTAIQVTLKLPTASETRGLGTGELDLLLAGVLTKSIGDYSVTGFYSLDLLGEPSGGFDIGHSLALLSTTPMFGRFAAFGELTAIVIPEQDESQLFSTVALTFNPSDTLVLDLGVVVGFTDDSPDFQLVFGLTQLLGPSGR